MLHLLYRIYFAIFFVSIGLTDSSDNIFEVEDSDFINDAFNAPASFNPRMFQDTKTENQSPDYTALLLANDQVHSASSVDVASTAGWIVEDGSAGSTQDISTEWSGDDSMDGMDGIAPASPLLDMAISPSDPWTSSSLVDTGYLIATSPTDYLGEPFKQFHIPSPDLMSIFQEKCPPIRVGETLIPLCCTGGRKGQTVTECRPYDITNWNCYLRPYQYCCKLFITESKEGVSCLKGFA